MSSDNVQVVRGIYDAYRRGDLDAVVAAADPEIRCYDRADRPGATVYRGHDGLRAFAESDSDVFENVAYEPCDFLHADDEHVVVRIRQAGRGRASSVPVAERIVNVWKLRDGRCIELRIFSTDREAFEALGVRPRA